MLVEVQFQGEAFLKSLHAKLESKVPGFDVRLPLPVVGEAIVDRVELGDPTFFYGLPQLPHSIQRQPGVFDASVPGDNVGVEVPFTVFLRATDEIEKTGVDAPGSYAEEYPGKARFRFFARFDAQLEPELVFQFENMTGTGQPQLDAALSEGLPALNEEVPLSLGALADVLGSDSAVTNVGIFGTPQGDFDALCIRAELIDVPNDVIPRWSDFFMGIWKPRISSSFDWAIFLDKELLVTAAHGQAAAGFVTTDDVSFSGDIDVSWDHVSPGATGFEPFGLRVETFAHLKNECVYAPNWTIGAEIFLHAGFRLQQDEFTTDLQRRTRVTWNLIDSDVFVCAFIGGLFAGAAVGATIGGIAGGFGGALVGAVVGGIVGAIVMPIVGAIIADGTEAPEELQGKILGEGQCVLQDTDLSESVETLCNTELDLSGGDFFGALAIEDVTADKDGLKLRGHIPSLHQKMSAYSTLKVDLHPTTYEPYHSCSSFSIAVETHHGGGTFRTTDGRRLQVVAAYAIDDPLGIVNPEVKHETPQRARVSLLTGGVPDEYRKNAYPLRALVLTNRGARVIDIGILPEWPNQDMTVEERMKLITHCKSRPIPLWARLTWLLPDWIIDPPYDDVAVLHHWRVVIAGLPDGERVSATHSSGEVVSEVTSAEGLALVDVVVEPAAAQELTLARSGKPFEPEDTHGVLVEQRLLVRDDVIRLKFDAHALAATRSANRDLAAVVGPHAARVYAFGEGHRAPLLRLPGNRFTGVRAGKDGELMLFGPHDSRIAEFERGRPRLGELRNGAEETRGRAKPSTTAWIWPRHRRRGRFLRLADEGRALEVYSVGSSRNL